MKVGFSGTQEGMTEAQRDTVIDLITMLEPEEAAHGDCVGADADFHEIVSRNFPDTWIVAHPCDLHHKRAYKHADVVRGPLPPLTRNRNIVSECDLLIITPKEAVEQLRSGTWATWRYAGAAGLPRVLVKPDGSFRVEPGDGALHDADSHVLDQLMGGVL